ncbi:MAG: type 1 glutamine amidotransferase [Bdellovibrionales bacterium]|nr:type 1 glutamine amidotransferase [Bdellovibrionales bacterium]
MKILVVDNNVMNESWGARDLVRSLTVDPSITVVVRRAPALDLPADPRGFDKIVFSGSLTAANDRAPWIEKHDQFLKQSIALKKPTLCICYGHQALGRVLGGWENVAKTKTPEYGWTQIDQKPNNRLFKGLPDRFYSFSSHFDEVLHVPKGTRLTATSPDCGIQGIEMEDAPVFGIQFHPEKSLDEGNQAIARRKKSGVPKVLLNADRGSELFSEQVAQVIFSNFLKE